jgi:hypothetical protein
MRLAWNLEVSMPETPTELTDEEKTPDDEEELRPEDSPDSPEPMQQARPSEEFDKIALDTGPILDDSFGVDPVLDDGDMT